MLYNPNHEYRQKDDVARALAAAADLLERSNWIQGGYERIHYFKSPGYCMTGAINKVITGDAKNSFTDFGRECYIRVENMTQSTITSWNDKKGRTKAEVVAILREVANQR